MDLGMLGHSVLQGLLVAEDILEVEDIQVVKVIQAELELPVTQGIKDLLVAKVFRENLPH